MTVWTHQLDGTASTETMSVSGSTNVIQVRRFPLTTHHEHALSSLALRRALRDETAEFDVNHVHGYHDTPLLWLRNCAHARAMVTPHYHGDSASRLRSLVHPDLPTHRDAVANRARRVGCVSGAEQERFLDVFANYRDPLRSHVQRRERCTWPAERSDPRSNRCAYGAVRGSPRNLQACSLPDPVRGTSSTWAVRCHRR